MVPCFRDKIMVKKIGIIDCAIGNVGSLKNTFSYLGCEAEIVVDPEQLLSYEKVILPGVGAFDTAMKALNAKGFIDPLHDYVDKKKHLLGICLGMQILFEGSEEGTMCGLGILNGKLQHLKSLGCQEKVPHVGFNSIQSVDNNNRFFQNMNNKDFYFVHTFALEKISNINSAVLCEYGGINFIAALQTENIFATQFHPEKSGVIGLELLKRFILC